jgi:hypothetical protein
VSSKVLPLGFGEDDWIDHRLERDQVHEGGTGLSVREAIGQHRSFNLIHLDARLKLGVFVARPRDFDHAQLARRQLHLLGEDPDRLLIMQAYYTERRLDHDTPLATVICQ